MSGLTSSRVVALESRPARRRRPAARRESQVHVSRAPPTCSSAATRCTFSNTSGSLCSTGGLPVARVLPRGDVGEVARRRAAPRRPASGAPRGSARRTTPRGAARRGTCSSANSRKSATRPACSSDWFSSSPRARHRDVRARTPRAARESSASAVLRPASLRAMPHVSHMMLAELAVERRRRCACP